MTDVPLRALNLESKWPKLAALQDEIASLEKRLHRARGAVHVAQGQLGPARERDLTDAGRAIRARKAVPEPEHEPKVKAELEAAQRMAEQVSRALQAAREDYGNFLAIHQSALYGDVLEARDQIGREVAQAAQEAQRSYSRYADMHHVIKGLTPPPPVVETGPPGSEDPRVVRPVTNSFLGVHTTQASGPARGDIEAALGYLASLAPSEDPAAEESGDDAAA